MVFNRLRGLPNRLRVMITGGGAMILGGLGRRRREQAGQVPDEPVPGVVEDMKRAQREGDDQRS